MNGTQTRHAVMIMNAHLDGKIIECRLSENPSDAWEQVDDSPTWNWYQIEYRIKPEPSYRPWRTVDEVPIGAIIRGVHGQLRTIIQSAWTHDQINIMIVFANGDKRTSINSKDLESFTMDDGSPCGIKMK